MNEVPADLARPKSRILRVQSDRTTMLLGFRSLVKVRQLILFFYILATKLEDEVAHLWMMPARWRCLMPQSIW